MDERIKNVFPEGLPDGVTASYVSIGGTPTLVFKQDGKALDQAQLRYLVNNQKKAAPETNPIEEHLIPDFITTPVYPGIEPPKSDVIRVATDIKNNQTPPIDNNNQPPVIERTINQKRSDGQVITGGYTLSASDDETGYKLETQMRVMMMSNQMRNVLFNADINEINYGNMLVDNAVYKDIAEKEKSGIELTSYEKCFVETYKKELDEYGLSLDANGDIINK